MGTKIYRGLRTGAPGEATVVVVEVLDQFGNTERVYDLPHKVRHSPSGFEWGYEGSGPAELARCIVIDALESRAVCKGCAGRGTIVEITEDGTQDIRCWGCSGDGVDPDTTAGYQGFKREHVARWQGEAWAITSTEVLDWLRDRVSVG